MSEETILVHQFDNGLVLLGQPMRWLESAAFAMLVPAGSKYDPPELVGLSNLTCEMVRRGCGPRDSRQFVEDLDNLGVDRSASVGTSHASFGAAMPAENLLEVLAIYADLVRRPHLPESQFEEARLVCLHEIQSIEDDLAQKMMLELRHRFYPDPYGRPSHGTRQAVEQMRPGDVRRFFQHRYGAQQAILSVAGNFDWARLCECVHQQFADWTAQADDRPHETPPPGESMFHIPHNSNQTHIGIAYPNVPYGHPDYFQARGAVGILSDGMSSRLFTEVRELRGLCYSVYAVCHSLPGRGCVMCYAGTTTDRAQETLDVTLAELRRLSEGVDQSELDRLKARIKTALIMQQESSFSRSSSMAADWYFLGRVQTLQEVRRIIDHLSCESINRYLRENPPRDFRIVTLGAKPLEASLGVS